MISVKLDIDWKIRVRNNGIKITKKSSMFPNLQKSHLRGSYTVYMDVLESRQVGRHLNLFKVFLCIAHTDLVILPNTI